MTNPRLLIVDDDHDFAESLALALETRGCEVTLAHSGEEAVSLSGERPYDLTFLDVRMPGIDGVASLIEILRRRPDAKVVLMMGFALDDALLEAREAGAEAVLRKPLDMQRVVELLDSVIATTILVADDDADFVASLQGLFSADHAVLVARDGREAVEQARANRVDLILLDLRMPGLDGLEVLQALERDGRRPPVVVVTAFADAEPDKLRALGDMNVDTVIRKPFDPGTLVEAVRRTLDPGGGRA